MNKEIKRDEAKKSAKGCIIIKKGVVVSMAKVFDKPKKYACFTVEQQEYFNKLPKRQRAYVEFRGQGYKKTEAYRMAGYDGKTAGQAAYMLEQRNPAMVDCIETLQNAKKAKDLLTSESKISQQIDALAMQQKAEDVLAKIDGMDGEQARRIKFYRDIVEGKIKTVRKTKKLNAMGVCVETKIEEVSDIEGRMKARRELDRLLGLQEIVDLGNLQVGDITINIVDASRKEELADERNIVNLDMDKVEVIDGEEIVVAEEKTENADENNLDTPSEADKFFESVGEQNDE